MAARIDKQADSELAHVFLKEAWSKLVSGQGIDNSLLRHDIALSWHRCLEFNISPVDKITDFTVKDLLEKERHVHNLLTVAQPHMRNIYDIVKGKGYIVFLTDVEEDILKCIGDRKILNDAEMLTLVPGASCSEKLIGTTSPGISLIQKKPIQVSSHEHFCQQYHNWCCSSAPIFDVHGGILGTLNLSSNDMIPHSPLLLDLVRITARAIETEFNLKTAHEDFKKSYHYLNSVVDDLDEAFIFFDNNNSICHMNKNAAKLLGKNSVQFLGESIENIAVDYVKTGKTLSSGQCRAVMQFPLPNGTREVSASLKELKQDRKKIGLICQISPEGKEQLKGESTRFVFDDFICRDSKMKSVVNSAQKIATTDVNVFIQGESGTGKEILAQAIHNASSRKHKPFVAVNCAAIPNELMQSELFGYEEGSFTGARKGGRQGKFELAQQGTIFLDEIGDMPVDAQANLLRVLQERNLTRIGGAQSIPLDIRIIAATNRNLLESCTNSNFREDLFYRLSVFSIWIPPLRERPKDVWPIMDYLIRKHSFEEYGLDDFSFSKQVSSLFTTYDWPGNVRELENTVIYFLNKADGKYISIRDIPEYMAKREKRHRESFELQEVEYRAIHSALSRYGNNMTKAAKVLGISRATLYRKIKQLGYERKQSFN